MRKKNTQLPSVPAVAVQRVVGALTMWCVIVKSMRSEWIHWQTIDRTRTGSWKKYKDGWLPDHHPALELKRRKGEVRLSRVRVAECSNGRS